MKRNKVYLGDGVYVERTDYLLRLTVENGIQVTNEIWLEPEIVIALRDYIVKLLADELTD